MILDTSALLAILFAEEERASFLSAVQAAERCRMSAANYLEAAIVIDNRGDAIARREFDRLIRKARVEIEPVTMTQAEIARQAYRDFGKGHHPAGLNFGDCLAYALSKDLEEPLLFKGRGFIETDVRPATPPPNPV